MRNMLLQTEPPTLYFHLKAQAPSSKLMIYVGSSFDSRPKIPNDFKIETKKELSV